MVVQWLSHVQLLETSWTQHAWLSSPSLSPRVCLNSCPLSRWCYLTISSSTIPFSFCLQSSPVSRNLLDPQRHKDSNMWKAVVTCISSHSYHETKSAYENQKTNSRACPPNYHALHSQVGHRLSGESIHTHPRVVLIYQKHVLIN